jgi:hypothetical protein
MPGLGLGIHVLAAPQNVDGRDKPGHDELNHIGKCSNKLVFFVFFQWNFFSANPLPGEGIVSLSQYVAERRAGAHSPAYVQTAHLSC